MFRSWEIPRDKREQEEAYADCELNARLKVFERYTGARILMGDLFALPTSTLSQEPTEEMLGQISEIAATQSLRKLLTYHTNLLDTSPSIHPNLASAIIGSLTDAVSKNSNHMPAGRNLRDFFVEIDAMLTGPEGKRALTDPFLKFVEMLIKDPDQICIGFDGWLLSSNQIAGIRRAIKEKNTRRAADILAHFWQNDGEFADDETIRIAHALWLSIGEYASEDPLFPIPQTYEKARSIFMHIMDCNEIGLKDRRAILPFYEEAKKIAHLLKDDHRGGILSRTAYSIILA